MITTDLFGTKSIGFVRTSVPKQLQWRIPPAKQYELGCSQNGGGKYPNKQTALKPDPANAHKCFNKVVRCYGMAWQQPFATPGALIYFDYSSRPQPKN
jgi:hypothetical protein